MSRFGECDNVSIIDDTPVVNDATLTEEGFVELTQGQATVEVVFNTVKASDQYRFEYLYVDVLGKTNPGTIYPVPITQTIYGFFIALGGAPIEGGYVLRWRVVVVSLLSTGVVDEPESFRVQLPHMIPGTRPPPIPETLTTITVPFVNPRSTTGYGFTEFRVENLVDAPTTQSPIVIQVCQKTLTSFKAVFSPTPPTANYYLVARTP